MTHHFPILLSVSFLALASCGSAEGQDTPFNPYGQDQVHLVESPDGPVSVVISAWRDSNGKSVSTLLTEQAKLTPAGETVTSLTEPTVMRNNIVVMSRVHADKANQARGSILVACPYAKKDGYFRWVEASGPQSVLQAINGGIVVKPMMDALFEGCKMNPRLAKSAALKEAVSNAPGKGDGVKKLKTILYTFKVSYRGDFSRIQQDTYALMKDGWAYKNPSVSVDDLNVERSRELEPGKWFKWRAKGGDWELRDPRRESSKWKALDGRPRELSPKRRKTVYSDTYRRSSASGSYAEGVATQSSSYTFAKDGTYKTSSSSYSGSGTRSLSVPGFGFSSQYSSCDSEGHRAGSSSVPPALEMRNKPKSDPNACGDANAGEYTIDGYTIELRSKAGTVSRLPFYQVRDDSLYIGNQSFLRKPKK